MFSFLAFTMCALVAGSADSSTCADESTMLQMKVRGLKQDNSHGKIAEVRGLKRDNHHEEIAEVVDFNLSTTYHHVGCFESYVWDRSPRAVHYSGRRMKPRHTCDAECLDICNAECRDLGYDQFAVEHHTACLCGNAADVVMPMSDGCVNGFGGSRRADVYTVQSSNQACPLEITYTITSTERSLCMPSSGGQVQYRGRDCGEGRIEWTSAAAVANLREGRTSEACSWDWLAHGRREYYAGSCGVAPTGVDMGSQLPTKCIEL